MCGPMDGADEHTSYFDVDEKSAKKLSVNDEVDVRMSGKVMSVSQRMRYDYNTKDGKPKEKGVTYEVSIMTPKKSIRVGSPNEFSELAEHYDKG